MRAELTNLHHCAVPFLSRAAVNLCWYDSITPPCTVLRLTVEVTFIKALTPVFKLNTGVSCVEFQHMIHKRMFNFISLILHYI